MLSLAVVLAPALLSAPPGIPPPVDVVEEVSGFRVADPYRHLEDPAVSLPFAREQTAHTAEWLKAHEVPGMRAELDALLSVGFAARPRLGGDRVFYVKQEGKAEQPTLYVRMKNGKEKALLDLTRLDPAGKTALDWFHPSGNGKLLAYGLSRNGDENSTLRIMDVDTGKNLKEEIPDTRWCDLTWLPGDKAFVYRRFPRGERYSPRLYLHTLGKDPALDAMVFGEGLDKTFWPGARLSDDGKSLVITVSRGWSAADLHVLDLATLKATAWVTGLEANFTGAFLRGGDLYVLTNHGAPRGRIVKIRAGKTAPAEWEVLAAEGADTLEDLQPTRDGMVTTALRKAVSALQVRGKDGALLREVDMPGVGSINAVDAAQDGSVVALEWSNYLSPPRISTVDTAPGTRAPAAQVVASVKADLGLGDLVVEQVEYPSYDGTRVPMFLVHRKDAPRDGSARVLVNAYGGFNVSLTPAFSRRYLYWLKQGHVLAVPNLRGGGELGEGWHQAGRKQNKHQVFRDMEYAMRWLVAENWARPQHLAIVGGSNGGLLMGAMITQVPHLFAATYASVGLFDMVRFHRWPPAELWIDEYGSSGNADEVGYLWGYSPYHQVVEGVRYPSVLVATAEEDTRVTWLHSAKFAARLLRAQAGDAPILLHLQGKEGHGQGKGRTDQVDEAVRMYTFLLAQTR